MTACIRVRDPENLGINTIKCIMSRQIHVEYLKSFDSLSKNI